MSSVPKASVRITDSQRTLPQLRVVDSGNCTYFNITRSMFNHEPEVYQCPFSRLVAGGENDLTTKRHIVLRHEPALAFAASRSRPNNRGRRSPPAQCTTSYARWHRDPTHLRLRRKYFAAQA